MDIDQFVKKQMEDNDWYNFPEDSLRTALTEFVSEHESDKTFRLVAVNREVVELNERIRQLESQSVPVEVFDSHCNYASFAGRVCNKCGRIHDGGNHCTGSSLSFPQHLELVTHLKNQKRRANRSKEKTNEHPTDCGTS